MFRQTFAVFFVTTSLAACGGQNLAFSTYEKSDVDILDADTVVLIDGFGQPDDLSDHRQALAAKFAKNGYFGVVDASHERTILVNDDNGGLKLNNNAPLTEKALTLELDILEQHVVNDYVMTEATDEAGQPIDVFVPVRRAEVRLDVYLVADDGFALMTGVEFHGVRETEDMEALDEDLIIEAADGALTAIKNMIAPRVRTHYVTLDDEDESMHAMIDIAQGGDLAKAIAMADEQLAKSPDNAAAQYNKAVFIDATGDYDAALDAYDAAIALDGTKEFYRDSRNRCFDRKIAAAALTQ